MTQKERKQTNGRHPEILNLNETMVNSLIKKVEETITSFKEKQNALLPELTEAEQLYMPLKLQYEELEALVAQEQLTLETLVGIKQNKNERKQVRVLRSVSNEELKDKRHKKRYKWLEVAMEVLKHEQKFMSFDAIIRKVVELHPEYAIGLSSYSRTGEKGTRTIILSGFTKSADPKLRSHPRIVMYNEKFGLPTFVDKHGRPLPKYLKSTMQPLANAV